MNRQNFVKKCFAVVLGFLVCGVASAENQTFHQFCSTIKDGTCTVKDTEIKLQQNAFYTTDHSLVFDNAKVSCVDTHSIPCAIHLQQTLPGEITLKQATKLEGSQVIIQAHESRVSILDSSSINTSGRSHETNGTQKYYLDGANYIGLGGSCNRTHHNFSTHGRYDSVPQFHNISYHENQMGSMGNANDVNTAGGGRIVIIADSIVATGYGATLQANAKPYENVAKATEYADTLVGGSGGYIYVRTMNHKAENVLGDRFRIEAKGGFGMGRGYGGSGGIVVFEGAFNPGTEQVTTIGGEAIHSEQEPDGCGNGAPGTLYYHNTSRLLINNENRLSTHITVLVPHKNEAADSSSDSNEFALAQTVEIRGLARVYINSLMTHNLLIENLQMGKHTVLGIVSQRKEPYILHLGQGSYLDQSTTLDLSDVWRANLIVAPKVQLRLGNIFYDDVLHIQGGQISVSGQIKVTYPERLASEGLLNTTKFILSGDSLLIENNTSIKSAFTFLHAKGDLTIRNGVEISSYIEHSCATAYDVPVMFSCVPAKDLVPKVTTTNFMKEYQRQFNTPTMPAVIEHTTYHLSQGYTVYMLAEAQLSIESSSVQGPRLGLCASDIDIVDSVLNAAEQGCARGMGIGHGKTADYCSGAGGSHGGYGGQGVSHAKNTMCDQAVSNPYAFGDEALFEGSAGASATPLQDQSLGGAGGGIIWITSPGTTALTNTTVTVKGQDGKAAPDLHRGSGGGAGGSIQVITKNIAGDALIDISGGSGSDFGGGGGSGGRLVTHLLRNFDYVHKEEQSLHWNGSIKLDGGRAGNLLRNQTNAVTLTTSTAPADGQSGISRALKCFGGYSGPFCKPCQVGEFKLDFGYGLCQPCTNKPENSLYDLIAENTVQCSYQCAEGFEPVSVNPKCLNSADLQIERVGGSKGSLVVFTLFFLFSLVIWIAINIRSHTIKSETLNRYSTVFDNFFASNEVDPHDDVIIGPNALQMRDGDIQYHTHRSYLIGENSINYPWFFSKDFPTECLSEQSRDRLLKFIHQEQSVLDWSETQKYCYYGSRLFAPFLSEQTHRSTRRAHFREASKKLYYALCDELDWDDKTGKTIRFSADEECRVACVDFLDFSKPRGQIVGPKLPCTLLIGGNGTLSTPYTLNFLDDPVAKSLVHLNEEALKDKLPPFLQNLNTLLDRLCFFKFNRQTMKDLQDIIEWVDLGNKTIFNLAQVKMTLYVFENSYKQVSGNEFKQRRRSMPLDQAVFDLYPSMFKKLIQHVQMKLLTRHSEIKLGIVIKPTTEVPKERLDNRVKELAGHKKTPRHQYENEQITAIIEEDTPYIQSEQQEPLLESDAVEIVDNSKRAYDTSVESTRMMEQRLLKKPKCCKHNIKRVKSIVYSLWILLFKMNGKPPKDGLSFWFLFFAMSLSFDILFTFVYLLHIVHPSQSFMSIGFFFLFVLPLLALVAPLWGIFSTIMGSARGLKAYSSINATLVAVNYSLTLFALWASHDQAVYAAVILFLVLNKILLSAFGSRVRQHYLNPNFVETQLKMKEQLADLLKMDICGRVRLPKAPKQQVEPEKGQPVVIDDAATVEHESAPAFDINQPQKKVEVAFDFSLKNETEFNFTKPAQTVNNNVRQSSVVESVSELLDFVTVAQPEERHESEADEDTFFEQ